MAKVIIGGDEIEVALPNFKTLKAAWKYVAAVQSSSDPMDGVSAILGVISVGKVGDPVTVDQLEERLTPAEMPALRPFMNELMIESGMATRAGEAEPAKEIADPSTATLTALSPALSPPDASAEAGIG